MDYSPSMQGIMADSNINIDLMDKTEIPSIPWKRAEKNADVGEMKRIETYAVEFDWIFRGNNAQSFIAHLASDADDTIFAIPTIQIIVNFLWERFYFMIRKKIFLPFIVYFVLFLFQVTLVYERVDTLNKRKYHEEFDLADTLTRLDYWKTVNIGLTVVIFVCILYFFMIEIRQMISMKLEYIKAFWNWFDIASLCINFSYLVIDIIKVDSY